MAIWEEIKDNYPVTVQKVKKVRDVVQLFTSQHGVLCLKGYDNAEAEVQFIAQVMQHVSNLGFIYAPKVIPTKTGALWVTRNGTHYMLTNWVLGEAPEFKDRTHIKKAIRTLAKFHRCAEGFPQEGVPEARNRYSSLPHLIASYRSGLEQQTALGDLTPFLSLCSKAIMGLNEPLAVKGLEQERSLGALAHGDYNYPNLVRDREGSFHLIDFENTSLHARIVDLTHILHRNFAWNPTETSKMIEKYDRIRPLCKEERFLLYTLLQVPYPIIRTIRLLKRANIIREQIPTRMVIRKYRKQLKHIL